jgi:RNA polymerase sigma-70 factor (ECF subfamily)
MTEALLTEPEDPLAPPTVEQFYRSHHAQIWRALLAYSGSADIASDAAAEAFAQALRRGGALRYPDRWIWKASFRIAAGMLKERSRFAPEIDQAVEAVTPVLELRWALRELSPRQRAATFLFYYGGYPPAEIARLIGSTQSAVRVHLFRGRKRLEKLLTEVDHG